MSAAAAAAVAALALPGAALAGPAPQCSGANIEGQGSTAQGLAQEKVWTVKFNTSKNGAACAGEAGQGTGAKPEVKYKGTGSGPGMEEWGLNGHATAYGAFAFIGTDQPPSSKDKDEIDQKKGTLLTIPVVQFAVSIDMHLPANCKATNKFSKAKGRLVLNNKTLEAIMAGEITKWNEIKDDGDKLSGTGCDPTKEFTRVVREEGSGTTATLKKYLFLINKTREVGPAKLNWEQSAEALENSEWNGTVHRVAKGKALAEYVGNNENTIGYANLADARATSKYTGANTPVFWAQLQNNGAGTKGKYTDPSTNGDQATALAKSNCAKEKYTNGKKAFPPKSALEPWNEVTTGTKQTNYTLCGITYDLAFTHYGDYVAGGAGEKEAQTAKDYLGFATNSLAEGGQPEIEGEAAFDPNGTDYLALPTNSNKTKNVRLIAQQGAAKIGF